MLGAWRWTVVGSLAAAALTFGAVVGVSTAATNDQDAAAAGCRAGATKVTLWSWYGDYQRIVDRFNATHPKICAKLEDVGAGNAEYVKLAQAIKSGTGAPDVAMIEYSELPSFEISRSLVDLAQYGANKYSNQFAGWAWKESTQGKAVYAIPGDAGPMTFYYNKPLLDKYGIHPPRTWSEFAAAAMKLHSANSSIYMTNFAAAELNWVLALMNQAGAFPFKYAGGSKVTINWTGKKQMAFAAYWQKLIDAKAVNTTTDVSAEAFGDMDNGNDASWLAPGWGQGAFGGSAKATVGNWRAAPLPQWSAGANVAANWGGSGYAVLKSSKHPAEAAMVAMWLNGSLPAWNIAITPNSVLFPAFKPELNRQAFLQGTLPLSGSSHPIAVFAAAAKNAPDDSWPPFMTQARTLSTTTFAGVLNGSTTLQQAFRTFQSQLVSYAKKQGFTVSTS